MIFSDLSYSYLYLTAGLLILIYFFKGIKRENRVSSLLFWQDLYKEKNSFSFRLKFSPDRMFFIQLLILLLLVTSLLEPVLLRRGVLADRVVLIIDQSASMKVLDSGRDRFSLARDRAVDLIKDLGDTTEIALIGTAGSAELLCDFTTDHEKLVSIIKGLEPLDITIDPVSALNMARNLSADDKRVKIVFISDGVFPEKGVQTDSGNLELIKVGNDTANIGIIDFDFRKKLGRTGEYEFFIKIGNFSEEKTAAALIITGTDNFSNINKGGILHSDNIFLEAHEVVSKTYTLSFDGLTLVEFRLDIDDPYQLDNSVIAVIGGELRDKFDILLVSRGNYFLENILGLIPAARVFLQEEPYFKETDYDLIIFDKIRPLKDYPGKTLYLGVAPPWDNAEVEAIEQIDEITLLDKKSPLFRFTDFRALKIADYLILRDDNAGKGAREVLLSTAAGPVMVAEKRPDKQSLFIGFRLEDSNMPLQVSFPIFILNLINWFNTEQYSPELKHIKTGDSYRFPSCILKRPLKVIDPAGNELPVIEGQEAYFLTDSVRKGIYRIIREDGTEDYFTANLLSIEESKLLESSDLASGSNETYTGLKKYPFWQQLLILVLFLLLLEWYFYYKPALSGGERHESSI
jgi:hypothetical protein